MKIKENLEAEKQEKNNQLDQDYWAEKAIEREGGLAEIEKELREDVKGCQEAYEESSERLRDVMKESDLDFMAKVNADNNLAKFLEDNPRREIVGVDFGPTLDALDGLTILK